ncbi:hypothetical protein TL16_g07007 [Triparma laevis f. inornata]|uniref:Uncharacterized protein n=2 Tax=Triparma laevis TaxID=1534972 RepID=A0A9W6Z9P1_9STRA|nr:hypothetical protein TrLO_g9414 [Triparma laevis f. longispina]GMH76216.1 hypothetical protein TL16_g07007 [Triparma laevis f. inornata]
MSTFSWVSSSLKPSSSLNSKTSEISNLRDSVQARYGSLAESMEERRLGKLKGEEVEEGGVRREGESYFLVMWTWI